MQVLLLSILLLLRPELLLSVSTTLRANGVTIVVVHLLSLDLLGVFDVALSGRGIDDDRIPTPMQPSRFHHWI